jgi:hypothetical protein
MTGLKMTPPEERFRGSVEASSLLFVAMLETY